MTTRITGRYRVTYQISTEESAEQGDYADYGYALPDGWKFSMQDERETTMSDAQAGEFNLTLRDALRITGDSFEDSGRWFSTTNDGINYSTDERTSYSIHPDDKITPASYRRLARLLCR